MASYITALAAVVSAAAAILTWRVYLQIKQVMERQSQEEFRPIIMPEWTGGGQPGEATVSLTNRGSGWAAEFSF